MKYIIVDTVNQILAMLLITNVTDVGDFDLLYSFHVDAKSVNWWISEPIWKKEYYCKYIHRRILRAIIMIQFQCSWDKQMDFFVLKQYHFNQSLCSEKGCTPELCKPSKSKSIQKSAYECNEWIN